MWLTLQRMLCTGHNWQGFGSRGLQAWLVVGSHELPQASHSYLQLPLKPLQITHHVPKLQPVREAHGASAHRYLRKQQPLRGEDTWLVALLGMWLETYSWKEVPCARAGTPLKGLWVMGNPHQSRDTAEGLCTMVNPCWSRGKQVRSKKLPHPLSPALPLTSPKGLGVAECNK